MTEDKRFAVLVDGENVSCKHLGTVLDEVSKIGRATIRRVYGDWTDPVFRKWRDVVLEKSFVPMQQFCCSSGKNSTDGFMMIDAMDILYSGKVDGFVLVTSDGDFTHLAIRLRESGMTVIGMGGLQAPYSLMYACDNFIQIANPDDYVKLSQLDDSDDQKDQEDGDRPHVRDFYRGPRVNYDDACEEVAKVIDEYSDENGEILSSRLGILVKNIPGFDLGYYGNPKFTDFLKASDLFKLRFEKMPDSPNSYNIYVSRNKR